MVYDDREWLSASQWKAITKCGEQFRLERVAKHPSRPAAWTVRGIAAHDAIEHWEVMQRQRDPLNYYTNVAWPNALAKTTEKFPDLSKWMKTPRVGTVAIDLKRREEDGLRQVERYVERALDEKDLWRVVAAEVPFEIEFPGILYRGFIDQIREWEDGFKYLVDVKTGNDESECNRQLGSYGLGYEQVSGERLTVGQYYYTKLDRPSDTIDLTPYTYDYMFAELKKVVEIKRQKLYLANPSKKNCFACGVSEFCLESKQ